MSQQNEKSIFPRFAEYKIGNESVPFTMPFYYDAVTFMWVYYKVPLDLLGKYLKGTDLSPAIFPQAAKGPFGIVSLDFQIYQSNLGSNLTDVVEVEFNLHGYPTSKSKEVPEVSFRDYMMGQEQTKWIGSFRLWVPASDPIAVAAGRLAFGERKFLTPFAFDVPVPNRPESTAWKYTVYDPGLTTKNPPVQAVSAASGDLANVIYTIELNLGHLGEPLATNPSPLTLYSKLDTSITMAHGQEVPPIPPMSAGRLNASRWNILGLDQTWLDLDSTTPSPVRVKTGGSHHEMKEHVEELIVKNGTLCALRYYVSPPAAIENRAFWVDPEPAAT